MLFLTSCSNEKIETGTSLNKATIDLIRSLRLLNKDEYIIKYYSNFNKDKAGSFFTDKRVAHYWLDGHAKEKSDTTFALYNNIIAIDSFYTVPDTFSPYIQITKNHSSTFKIYVEGTKDEMQSFFRELTNIWQKSRTK